MAEEHKKGLNADLVGNDLESCCRKEGLCGQCHKSDCIIGYGKQCIRNYKKEPKKEVADGMEKSRLRTLSCLMKRNWRRRLHIF